MKFFNGKKLLKKYSPIESTRYKNIKTEKLNDQSRRVKQFPELYINRKNCCGCSACYSICPVHAITMEPDVEGFLYPVVDATICIKCYKCINVCIFKKNQKEKGFI